MGRPIRIKAPDLTYHITSRTNGKRLYLKAKRDKKALCLLLHRVFLRHRIVIYTFNAMENHFHLFIHIGENVDLSKAMCEFKSQYAKYYNKKYGLCGHFWGNRFRSTIVEDDQHALACLRYIDRNPVKAQLVDHPAKWYLNSFNSYAYGKSHPLLPLQPHPTYLAMARTKARRYAEYRSFVLGADPFSDQLHGRLEKLQFFGSEEFIRKVKSNLE